MYTLLKFSLDNKEFINFWNKDVLNKYYLLYLGKITCHFVVYSQKKVT